VIPIGRAVRVAVVLSAVVGLGACVRRSDFAPPPAPTPVERAAEPALPAVPEGTLTVGEAVRLALERNPDGRAAAARVAEADARAAAAEAAYLPRLSAEVAYLRADTPSAFLFKRIDARRLPPNVDFNDPGEFSSLGEGLVLRWNLWRGGRDQLGAWAAEAMAEATAAERAAVRNALVATVVGVFLDAQAAAAARAGDDATVRTLETQVAATRVQVDGGAVLRTDLLSLEVRLAEAETTRLRTEVAERIALAILRELLALPPEHPVAVAGGGPTLDRLPPDVPAALAQAYARRPEAAAARLAVERAALELAASKRAWLPRLDVESRFGAEDAEARFSPVDYNWAVGVALSVDLFDGGARRADVHRALAALDAVGEADRATLVRIAREVESAYLRLEEARARLALVTRALATAEETLGLVATQHRGGAVTVTRFLEAESALARSRAAHVQGTLDLARAEVEVARAIGALGSGSLAGGPT
jgi:outer membrane protein TolC